MYVSAFGEAQDLLESDQVEMHATFIAKIGLELYSEWGTYM